MQDKQQMQPIGNKLVHMPIMEVAQHVKANI
jgi:hypothetical protein